MKAVTAKMLVSLIGVLLVAPFFAFALIVGARAVALSHGAQDDLLLAALAIAGAAVSVANGMGRRAMGGKRETGGRGRAAAGGARAREASVIHLGY